MQKKGIEPVWDDSRADELLTLRELLHDVSMLNSGNYFIERASRCIVAAKALTNSDLKTGRNSFCGFLEEQAIKSRKEGTQ